MGTKDEGRDLSLSEQEPAGRAQESKEEGRGHPITEQEAPGSPLRTAGGAQPPDGSGRPRLDFERLRLPQNGGEIGVKKLIPTVVPRKPGRQEFIRVHPRSRGSDATCICSIDRYGISTQTI
jgi:hypothetical protein